MYAAFWRDKIDVHDYTGLPLGRIYYLYSDLNRRMEVIAKSYFLE